MTLLLEFQQWAASVLEKTADRIERDEFDTGWYEVRDNVELDHNLGI